MTKQTRDGRGIDPALGALGGEASTMEVRRPSDAYPLAPDALPAKARDAREAGAREADGVDYYGMPALKETPWRWYVPAYFYVGGVVGAASTLGAAAQLAGGARLARLVARTRAIAALGSMASAALLIADLGRPARFLYMLRVFRPTSPMNLGTWVVSAIGAASSAAALFGRSRVGDACGLAAGAAGLPMSGYTGVLLANSAVPAWNGARASLPTLFVASAASGAASLLDLFDADRAEERAVTAFGVAGKLAELRAMRDVESDLAREGEAVARPLRRGRSAILWRAAKVLTAASLLASLVPGRSRAKRIAAGALGTAGAVCVRFAILQAGKASARDPRATFEPQIARAAARRAEGAIATEPGSA